MGWLTPNADTNEEKYGELGNMTIKMKETLGELECEEAIINDKERFGRVRMNMMKVLRAEHGNDIANRALGRVNKRIQEGYLNS